MQIKILIALVLLCLVVADTENIVFNEFTKFMKEYNKQYSNINEYLARYQIFKKNYERTQPMSVDPNTSHSVGITKFMDMTPQEFRSIFLNLKISPSHFRDSGRNNLRYITDSPAALDWRDKGAVGPVKDQGNCGSCWAFSTVGNLEGLHAIKTGKIAQYAEQQLVDCDKVDSGCNGGLMENAFKYIEDAGGIELQSDYPYHGRGESCHFSKDKVALKVTGFVVKNDLDEGEMKDMLASTGPLAIALNADNLQYYTKGIIDLSHDECDPSGLNHGVTLVGYGSDGGKDYWIVRNSWGKSWGEIGYFKIARGKGTCGINKYVTTATIE